MMAAVDPRCAVCGVQGGALKKCGKCLLVFYCSREHQKEDYRGHRTSCEAPFVEDPTAVDPLNVLKNEEVLHVCSYLRSADLLALHKVSRAWRKVVSEWQVWRHASLRLADNRSCIEVLLIAPYLHCVTLPKDLHIPPSLRMNGVTLPGEMPWRLHAAFIMKCATEVAGLRWEHRADPDEVHMVVERFCAYVRELHLGPVDCHAVHLVATLPLLPLRSLSIKTVTRGRHHNFTETSDSNGGTVRQLCAWTANDPEDCDRSCWTPTPLLHLLKKHCKSLEELELEKMGIWYRHTNEVTRALARCVSLRRAVLPCSAGLPQLAEHPSLRSLTVVMRSHLGGEHRDCLSALPASLESLTVVSHYGTLVFEVQALVRQAPRLTSLRSLTLRWRHYVDPNGRRRLTALELDPRPTLAAAFPAVRLTWDMKVVTNYVEMTTDIQEFDDSLL